MDAIDVFIEFLEERGLYDRIMEICKDENKLPLFASLQDEDPEDYLLSVFLFEKTKEGFDYWIKIQYEWLSYLWS